MRFELSDPAFFDSAVPRLRWLVRLRWIALGSVAGGLAFARMVGLAWVSAPPILAALAVGSLYNVWFSRRLRMRAMHEEPAGRRELQLHAVADVGALTLLLLSSGGLRNPVSMFYGFHVVLGAMLGFTPGALVAAAVSLGGIGLLYGAERAGLLLSPALEGPPLWLAACAPTLTVLSLAYFSLGALQFLRREQNRALENYQLLLGGLDALDVGLELVGPDGRLLLCNRRAAQVHPCPDGRWRPPEGLSEGTGPRRFAHQEGNETRIYEMLALPGDRPPSAGTGQLRAYLYVDRTESTMDEQRAVMLERLASLGRAMQGVAHELNTPLASIQTLAVDLSHTVNNPDAAESISLIIDEARRCREITRELLANTGRPGQQARVVLADLVRRAAKLVYGSQAAEVVLRGDLSLSCTTDGDRLLQILVNLLQNARDAAAAPAEVDLLRLPGDQVCIELRDRGPGLAPRVRERLFQPFVTTKPPGQGTGLGLYTCARLAQQLQGQLTVENAPGGGVCARLRLPLEPSQRGGGIAEESHA
ncbi:MAG: HAMP domain-containing sensor histidine kinase [Myxococcales bacterium]|nr:HAMP domain-containing histidine kinase [Myxococcota bacterium]MDW8282293.1 HAMP domain-containing sensor histidine kinase [Myxococcales bacterium]